MHAWWTTSTRCVPPLALRAGYCFCACFVHDADGWPWQRLAWWAPFTRIKSAHSPGQSSKVPTSTPRPVSSVHPQTLGVENPDRRQQAAQSAAYGGGRGGGYGAQQAQGGDYAEDGYVEEEGFIEEVLPDED